MKKLATNGIMVVLIALNEKMGLEVNEKLKECSLSDVVVFHQLDVTDPASVASLADFVKNQFRKLDILVWFKSIFIIKLLVLGVLSHAQVLPESLGNS